jgi:hypothetical protein
MGFFVNYVFFSKIYVICNTYISFVVMQKQKFVKREFTKNVLNSHIFVFILYNTTFTTNETYFTTKTLFLQKIHPHETVNGGELSHTLNLSLCVTDNRVSL